MKEKLPWVLVLCLSTSLFGQIDGGRLKNFNVRKGIMLEGYDPVSYFVNHPVEGDDDIQYKYKGVTYQFASKANLDTFKASPEKYEPAYGGWCAYAMGETGEKVKIDPETFKIIDGKLYVFYNFWGNNTMETWDKNEKQLKPKGDANWKKFVP